MDHKIVNHDSRKKDKEKQFQDYKDFIVAKCNFPWGLFAFWSLMSPSTSQFLSSHINELILVLEH